MTIVIGLTGSFASGCSYIAENFIVPEGYTHLSLSNVLKDMYNNEHSGQNPKRHELQKYGTEIRKKDGGDILAKKIVEEIKSNGETTKWVIDSIKNPHEIELFKNEFSKFFLFAVFADYDTRWERALIPDLYDRDQNAFNADDERDKDEGLDYGQKVSDCCARADVIICNDQKLRTNSGKYNKLKRKVENFISLVEGGNYLPFHDEPFMVMAYANSLRSSCLKRKVGAIIVDDYGKVCSSGYNEVPHKSDSCSDEGGCYRDELRQKFQDKIDNVMDDPNKKEKVLEIFKSCKILDYCRALHAEEYAIINLVRSGIPNIQGATLYSTTYPCNLCAKKIAQLRINKIVYLEPYPMREAKGILKENSVESKPFEGITPIGYFRFGGK